MGLGDNLAAAGLESLRETAIKNGFECDGCGEEKDEDEFDSLGGQPGNIKCFCETCSGN